MPDRIGGNIVKTNFLEPKDVRHIDETLLPCLVLTDNLMSFFGLITRKHTKNHYTHGMWMDKPGEVASQNWFYERCLIDEWLDGRFRVKLWRNPNWTQGQKDRIVSRINAKLALPKWKRLYDLLGVAGQGLGLDWLNIPWLDYCTESASEILRSVETMFTKVHADPGDMDRFFLEHYPDGEIGVFDPNYI
jgi:hypothetical protein